MFDRSIWKFWPKNENCLFSRTQFEFQFHFWSAENWSWLPIQVQFSYFLEFILLVEKLDHLEGKVYSRQATERNCLKSTSVLGHEILSSFNNTHKSCFLTEFTHFVFWWKRFNLLNVLLPNNLVIHGIFIMQRSFCFDFAKNNWLSHQYLRFLDLSWWLSNSSHTAATAP